MSDAQDLAEARAATDAYRRYLKDGTRLDDLDLAAARLTDLVDRLVPDSPVLPAALTNLCAILNGRHRSPRARWDDLDRAIDKGKQSVDLTDASDDWYPSRVNNYGGALRDRYQRTGTIDDLRHAVNGLAAILDHPAVPDGHRPMLYNNAAQGHRELYEVTVDGSWLRRAVDLHRSAVRLARTSAPDDLPLILSAAGITERTYRPDEAGSREALALQQESLDLTGPRDAQRPDRIGSLALSRLSLARVLRGPAALEALDEALARFSEAIEGTPPGDPNRSAWLLGRAEAYVRRWHLDRASASRAAALAAYDESLTEALRSSPITAPGVARAGALLAHSASKLTHALDFCRRGLQALDDLLPGQLARDDQRSWHRHAEDLAGFACVLHVKLGTPEKGVAVLESYRARDATLLAAVTRLTADDDERLRMVRAAIHKWGETGDDYPALDRLIGSALGEASARELRQLLRPTEEPATIGRAGRHVAFLLCTDLGGAVVVAGPGGEVNGRNLRRMTPRRARKHLRQMRSAYRRGRSGRAFDEALRTTGRWTATRLVRPMLDMVPPEVPLVLVPTGPLLKLPLLAANDPDHPLLGRPLSYAVRSFIPDGPTSLPRDTRTVAVVDGTPRVPYADGEAEVTGLLGPAEAVPSESFDPNGPQPVLEGRELIHFTCHGAAGDKDSAGTALRLAEGEESVLAAAQILRIDLSARPVVVLSSCEINHPDPVLPDQPFGPPAAFLHAGAQAVVAPLYEIGKGFAWMLSARLYHELALRKPLDVALADAQRWLATSRHAELARFLKELPATLRQQGRPHEKAAECATAVTPLMSRWSEPLGPAAWATYTISV